MNNSSTHRKHKSAGFTLVEMLMVLGVISFLAAALFVGTNKLRSRARMGATNVLIEKVRDGLEAYKLFYRAYPTPMPRTGMTNNESLYYYLTTSFRMAPNLANGEVASTLNAGPLCPFNEQELLDASKTGRMSIIDSWRMPLQFVYTIKMGDADPRAGWTQTQTSIPLLYSFGLNKKDENGAGDDVVAGK